MAHKYVPVVCSYQPTSIPLVTELEIVSDSVHTADARDETRRFRRVGSVNRPYVQVPIYFHTGRRTRRQTCRY